MIQKKVGIITIYNFTNYGNRLQNYALTKLLENEGIPVINGICVSTKDDWLGRTKSIWKRAVKRVIPYAFVKKKLYFPKQVTTGLEAQRVERFLKFTENYTTSIPPIVAKTHKEAYLRLRKLGIGCVIAGSDQIWNPYYEGKEFEFLTFAPSAARLSFAASIGVDHIPEEVKWYYAKNLKEMKYLSVREQRAVEIIKELTGRDADLTLDPTLLLEPEKWQEAVKKPNIQLDSDYICTYFLGEVPDAVDRFAKEKGLRIYPLNDKGEPELFVLDPGEFLYMIKNAAYILTDSFHAVAFSIKFHKEFYVFDRKQKGLESMFSRIETITQRFGLENRIQNRDAIVEQPPVMNWEAIDQELLREKKLSMGRLTNAMETE